jgi:hypothetical protein
MIRFASLLLIAVMTAGCGGQADDNAKKAAAAHAAVARANHERRLAWQKAHPAEYAAQRRKMRAELAAREERRRQDAAKRVTEQRARAARAAAAAAIAAEHTGCRGFGHDLKRLDVGPILASYDCQNVAGDSYLIHVTVRDEAWTAFSYDRRLQLAKGLWAMCVKSVRPKMADFCHVRLVGEAGEDLGGSSYFAGSMIDVSHD